MHNIYYILSYIIINHICTYYSWVLCWSSPILFHSNSDDFRCIFSEDFRGGHICDDTFGRAPGGGASSDRGPRAPTVLSFRRMKQFCWFMNPCQIMCERHRLHKHPAGPETVPIKRTFFKQNCDFTTVPCWFDDWKSWKNLGRVFSFFSVIAATHA